MRIKFGFNEQVVCAEAVKIAEVGRDGIKVRLDSRRAEEIIPADVPVVPHHKLLAVLELEGELLPRGLVDFMGDRPKAVGLREIVRHPYQNAVQRDSSVRLVARWPAAEGSDDDIGILFPDAFGHLVEEAI